jgi:mxaL protein
VSTPVPALAGWRRNRSTIRLALACLLLGLTFLQPQMPMSRPSFSYVVALDVTQSMSAADYEIDGRPVARLTYAKHALRQVLRRLPCGSRIGWAVFTEFRMLLLFEPVELCGNYHDVLAALDQIDGRMAWAGASEIARGLHSGLKLAAALDDAPRLVFLTDGHEAPPLPPGQRLRFEPVAGASGGIVVGVGGDTPVPIPKRDPDGNALGVWSADEVVQSGGASKGNEHLSSLREVHLMQISADAGLAYRRLVDATDLTQALTQPALSTSRLVLVDLRYLCAAAALVLLLAGFVARRRQ